MTRSGNREEGTARVEIDAEVDGASERVVDYSGEPMRYSERVRHYFLARTVSRMPEMTHAAGQLGISERSLRRKLAEEGVTYRQLAQGALEDAARAMLRDPYVSTEEVASSLGFSDITAFYRAFKRWVGSTPQAYRDASQLQLQGEDVRSNDAQRHAKLRPLRRR